ncbi:phosphonate metabolism protein PhnM [Maledivibacter halophilus]|uniref:Alpha-D-ribose 1-methylphosphonate 5-triphosphate diphosphatase n=1 Tax=Maledivibacter halophilus TaxID=36842 RepID=A0A1T5J969_9FIRM|nr:phosphonate metabolism protein PhnM [Maledivibacter halophilus]SKC47802.1 alpha-D-ribose 1-methylphosphonate 5-triphosphate diphosphatase [Maledivibacter halophilus]
MYLITNGHIITEDTILTGYDILIEDDVIRKIDKEGSISVNKDTKIIDADGGYVSPGFIDIHSDYIEHMAAPRPTTLMDFSLSLRECEKQLISHGITTMFHSLSLYKSTEFGNKPIRNPENVQKFIDLIDNTHESKHLIRHRFHARFEIDNIEQVDNLKSYINENKVHLVSFMDHTPGQGQYRNLEIYRDTLKGYKDLEDFEIDEIITESQSKDKLTIEMIKEIGDLAKEKGITIASHDDDTVEKIELVRSFGATISEFPITLETAKEAKNHGMHTIAGAPNVLLGGSHSGNLSAAVAIEDNCIDILCSDYYPAAMLHSIFKLHEEYGKDLVQMLKLVTINPAKAVNMDDEIGSIKENKKADILIIEKIEKNFPVITSVFVDGKLITKTNYRV